MFKRTLLFAYDRSDSYLPKCLGRGGSDSDSLLLWLGFLPLPRPLPLPLPLPGVPLPTGVFSGLEVEEVLWWWDKGVEVRVSSATESLSVPENFEE